MKGHSIIALVALAAGLLLSGRAQAQSSYRIVSLGHTPTTVDTMPCAVNDSGQVAASSVRADNYYDHALLWTNGVVQDLGTLGGRTSFARGMNRLGRCVGEAGTTRGYGRAFLWDGGKMLDITGKDYSAARAINDAGQIALIVGGRPALWQSGGFTYLPGLQSKNGGGYPNAINAGGVIVGQSGNQPVVWSGGKCTALPVLRADLVGGDANGINTAGVAVGTTPAVVVANSSGGSRTYSHPVLWKNGTVRDLGTLGGYGGVAWAINDSEQVVGEAARPDERYRAFIWGAASGMQDLNSLIPLEERYDPSTGQGWVLTVAYGISNSGYITGHGSLNGVQTGFLLIPVP